MAKDMTVEEFNDWCSATKKFEEVAEAADEVGGPRLSLVPLPEQNEAWPTDLLAPAAEPGSIPSASRCRGSSAAMPIRRLKPPRPSLPCSKPSLTWCRKSPPS